MASVEQIGRYVHLIVLDGDECTICCPDDFKVQFTLPRASEEERIACIASKCIELDIDYSDEELLKLYKEAKGRYDNCFKQSLKPSVESSEELTKAQEAVKLASNNCLELFVDQYGKPFSRNRMHDHEETISLDSKRFKNWLGKLYFESTKDVLKSEDISSVCNLLKAEVVQVSEVS